MIKSVTYLSEGKKSYELSDESDIQTLDTSVAEGSVARVTGKITAEYELKGGNWVKTAGGSGGGGSGTMKVTFTDDNGGFVADKTFSEVYDAIQSGVLVYANYVSSAGSISGIYYLDAFDSSFITFDRMTILSREARVSMETFEMSVDGISHYTVKYPAS